MLFIHIDGQEAERGVKRLYERHAARCFHLARGCGVSRDDVEDVVQNAFINIVKAWRKSILDSTGKLYQKPAAYLYRTVINCSYEFLDRFVVKESKKIIAFTTRLKGGRSQDLPSLGNPTQDVAFEVAFWHDFEVFCNDHPERARALMLRAVGLSMAEVAEELGRTERATAQYLSQCRIVWKRYFHSVA